jgi:hypothetical protein
MDKGYDVKEWTRDMMSITIFHAKNRWSVLWTAALSICFLGNMFQPVHGFTAGTTFRVVPAPQGQHFRSNFVRPYLDVLCPHALSASRTDEPSHVPGSSFGVTFGVGEREGRRNILVKISAMALAYTASSADAENEAIASAREWREKTLVIPLQDCGGAYCVQYLVDNRGPFRAVIDTGSPFLTVAGSCTERWGCYKPSLVGERTLYSDTIEVYAGKEGPVNWRQGLISFLNGTDENGEEWGARAYTSYQDYAQKLRGGRMKREEYRAETTYRVRGQVGARKVVFGVLSDGRPRSVWM